jgi:hypothetical protein
MIEAQKPTAGNPPNLDGKRRSGLGAKVDIEIGVLFWQQATMKTALELPDDALDDGERYFLNVIREHGWFSTRVFDHKGTQPDFTYSTGFSARLDFPGIIVFGLPKDTAHSILWDVWRDIETGKRPHWRQNTRNFRQC